MKLKLLIFTFLSLNSAQIILGQGCASLSQYPYEWPAHRNWFVAAGNGWTGQIIDMQTLAITTVGAPGSGASNGGGVTTYEGCATVSDDAGNLLMFSNGRKMFTGIGAATQFTYNGLLEGNEGGGTGFNGSASQGIIAFRHPTAPNDIHVFTTDDANSGGTVGLNHFVFDLTGNLTSGPTRLGTFRTTEALAATRHSNGIDFWVTAMDDNGNFHAYLLTCTGIDLPNSNLNQAGGPNITNRQQERGGLAFSYDSQKMAQAHGSSNAAEKVSLYDFDNTTGAITNRMNIGDPLNIFGPYDIIFSPDNNRLFVSWQNSTLTYFDLSSGVQATIQASSTNTGLSCGIGCSIQMGASGKLYMAKGNIGGAAGTLREINEDINTSSTFSTTDIAGTETALGLPRMFLPPLDRLEIQDPGNVCSTAPSFDLSTSWVCAGSDAETLPHTYTSTKGAITDANAGTYDPSIVGVGVDTVIFTLTGSCGLSDTLIINVINCACIDPQIGSPTITVCPIDSSFNLNIAYSVDTATYPGTWTVTAPGGSTSNPLSGSNFNANGVDVGSYTISYTLVTPGDPACPPTERQITVANCCPAVTINPSISICVGETTDLSTQVTAGSGTYNITNGPGGTAAVDPNTGLFTSDPSVSGTYTVTFTTDILGCVESDAIDITVNPYPFASIVTDAASICTGQTANLIASSSVGSGVTFTWNDLTTGSTKAVTSPGKYTVTAAKGSCTHDTSIVIGATPSPSASLPLDTTICTLRGETYTAAVIHNAGANAVINWNSIGSTGDSSVTISSTPAVVVVTVTGATGCVASDSIEITEYCIPPEFETPNVFNPGGENPTWTPFGNIVPEDLSNSHLEIYDRWGLKMFETNETLPLWNGTNNGRNCSSGVYFWIWTYTETTTGNKKSINGFVHLINQK